MSVIPLHAILSQVPWYARRQISREMKYLKRSSADCGMYITGRTGSGKSSLLAKRVYQLRWASRKRSDISIVVIDPHGSTVEQIRRFDLAKKYHARLVYLDPLLRKGYVPCINPFRIESFDIHDIEVHTQQLVDAFQEIIDAKLSNFMKALLTPCIATLLHLNTC